MSMNYVVKLQNFEGPLDLLLDLIKHKEMDIFDIQISEITNDYVESLKLMREHDVDITSDFTEMASILLSIKTKMMLPTEQEEARDELVKRLVDYREYKRAAERLQEMKEIEEKYFKRQKQEKVKKQRKASITDITKIYHQVLELKHKTHNKKDKLAELNKETMSFKYSVEGQMEYLQGILTKNRVDVYDMFISMQDKEEIVETFGAILELSKIQFIKIIVENNKFYIERRESIG